MGTPLFTGVDTYQTCAAPATVSRCALKARVESITHWIVTNLGRGLGEPCSPETGRKGGVYPGLCPGFALFATGQVAVGDDGCASACVDASVAAGANRNPEGGPAHGAAREVC